MHRLQWLEAWFATLYFGKWLETMAVYSTTCTNKKPDSHIKLSGLPSVRTGGFEHPAHSLPPKVRKSFTLFWNGGDDSRSALAASGRWPQWPAALEAGYHWQQELQPQGRILAKTSIFWQEGAKGLKWTHAYSHSRVLAGLRWTVYEEEYANWNFRHSRPFRKFSRPWLPILLAWPSSALTAVGPLISTNICHAIRYHNFHDNITNLWYYNRLGSYDIIFINHGILISMISIWYHKN